MVFVAYFDNDRKVYDTLDELLIDYSVRDFKKCLAFCCYVERINIDELYKTTKGN